MKKKPKGRKYRNLFNRDGMIYYERRSGSKRVKFSCKTDDWTVAAQVRDLWEEKHGTPSVQMLSALGRSLSEAASFGQRCVEFADVLSGRDDKHAVAHAKDSGNALVNDGLGQ